MKLEELINLRKNTTYNFKDIGNRDELLFSVFYFVIFLWIDEVKYLETNNLYLTKKEKGVSGNTALSEKVIKK